MIANSASINADSKYSNLHQELLSAMMSAFVSFNDASAALLSPSSERTSAVATLPSNFFAFALNRCYLLLLQPSIRPVI